MKTIRFVSKVLGYITHGGRLLVFRHLEAPEAGVQVPAGTVEPGESLEHAVLREAHEETGLEQLKVVSRLGQCRIDMTPFGKREIHERTFFHLEASGKVSERWVHHERMAADGGAPIPLECYWVRLADCEPDLAARQGDFLYRVSRAAQEGTDI